MFFFQEGFTYRNFLLDVFTIFYFVVWFWLLIIVGSDLFRRHDISGWVKAMVLVEGSSGAITLALPTPEINSLPNWVALARPERRTLTTMRSLALVASSLEAR